MNSVKNELHMKILGINTAFLFFVFLISFFELSATDLKGKIVQKRQDTTESNNIKPAPFFQSHMVLQQNKPINIWGTATPNLNITVSLDEEFIQTVSNERGEWSVSLPSRKASFNSLNLKINNLILEDILIGELWICSGQSNMVRPLKEANGGMETYEDSKNENIRLLRYDYPPLVSKSGYRTEDLKRCNATEFFKGTWSLNTRENAEMFSSVAWFFGKQISDNQKVPVGLIQIAVGGSAINNWVSPHTLKSEPETKSLFTKDWLSNDDVDPGHRNRCKEAFCNVLKPGEDYIIGETPYRWMCEPGFLFEAGIKPLKKLNFRGVIWYQGETDAITENSVSRYKTLFPLLVNDWRNYFEFGNFPFIYVQLPRFGKVTWPEFREVQRIALQHIPNCHMAVTIDLGEEKNIHPVDKLPVGNRIASLAINNVYKTKRENTTYPEVIKIRQEEKCLILTLNEKIAIKNKQNIPGFELDDQNGKFYPAKAYFIDNRHIGIKIDGKPVSIRYGWKSFPQPPLEIFNSEGFPLGPFMSEIN